MFLDFSKIQSNPSAYSEQPNLLLQTLSERNLGYLQGVYNLHFTIGFSELSEISFTIPRVYDGLLNPLYDQVVGYKVVYTKNYGVYVLANPEINGDGLLEEKSVRGYSIEKTFERKDYFLAEGVYNFYDPLAPEQTLLGILMSLDSSWEIGEVSPSLINKYRTFDQYKENALSFLYGDLIEKYKCFVVCDPYKNPVTGKRRIHFYDSEEALTRSPIYLTYENLVENVKVSEETDNLSTQLSVYGADGLSIREVNPIGTDYLVNLDYFVENGDIGDGLPAKLKDWQKVIDANKEEYATLSALRASANSLKFATQAERVEEKGKLDNLINQQSVIVQAIAAGLKTQSDLNDINAQISTQKEVISRIDTSLADIDNKLEGYSQDVAAILEKTKYEKFFSDTDRETLDKYLIQSDITDETFVASDIDPKASGEVKPFSGNVEIKESVIDKVEITPTSGAKTIYSIKGGKLVMLSEKLSSNIINGTLEVSEDNSYVCSFHLGTCVQDGKVHPSALVTLFGNLNNFNYSGIDPSIVEYNEIMDEVKKFDVNLNKTVYGNIDTNNRQVLEWTEDNLIKFKSALDSWGDTADELRGSISTVLGRSSNFGGVEIAYSPLLQTSGIEPELLNKEVVEEYIRSLLDIVEESHSSWSTEDLLAVDKAGLYVSDVRISNLIADAGRTAIKTGMVMHYTGKDGAVALAYREVEEAARNAGMSTEEFLAEAEKNKGELSFNSTDSTFYLSVNVTEYQKYSVSKELYDYGVKTLAELAYPTYEFSIDTANFLFQEKFAPYKDALRLGNGIYLVLGSMGRIVARVIGISFDFEDVTSMSLTFSNKFQRVDGQKVLKEIIEKTYSSSRSFEAKKYLYNQSSAQSSKVSDFMRSSLDSAKNTIINSKNQSVTIDGSGIQITNRPGGAEVNPDNPDDKDYQMRIVDRMLAITDDGWQTAKLAIGHFKSGEYGDYFGVNADVIAGKLLVGNNLVIEAPKTDAQGKPTGVMQFKVGSTGTWLNNASFILQNDAGSKMVLDPQYGLVAGNGNLFDIGADSVSIKPSFMNDKNQLIDDFDNVITDKTLAMPKNTNFYLDAETGQAFFRGKIFSEAGEIGGWTAEEDKLYSGSGSSYVALSSSGNDNYAIWAGGVTPGTAKFSVKRDGTVKMDGDIIARSFKIKDSTDEAIVGNQISGGSINAKGIWVKDGNGKTTFRVYQSGKVEVNGDITMGPGSTISWGQVSDKPDIPTDADITRITESTITTTSVTAKNLTVDAANISGTLTVGKLPSTVIYSGDNISNLNNDSLYQTSSGVTSIVKGTITTEYIKTIGITADSITSGNLNAGYVNISGELSVLQRDGETVAGTLGCISGLSGSWGVGMVAGSNRFTLIDGGGASLVNYRFKPNGRDYYWKNQVYVTTTTTGVSAISKTGHEYSVYITQDGCFSTDTIHVSSDARLKENIEYDMDKYEGFFMDLKPCGFVMKSDPANQRFGFIAQDIMSVWNKEKASNRDGYLIAKANNYYAIAYEEIIALNTYMIQKMKKKVHYLENEINALKGVK